MKRKCGACSACCRWFAVKAIAKPAKTPCRFLDEPGYGCTIYADRPKACAEYRCSWLRGIGEERDQPFQSGVMIDRRMTQFGHVLVAKSLKPGAAMTRKGRAAIQNATRDDGLPCLIVDYEDTERVIGVAGSQDLREEVESKMVDGMIRIGGSVDFIENLVDAALVGHAMSEVRTDGR